MNTPKFYKDFGISRNDKKYLKKQLLYKLYRRPKKEKGSNLPKTIAFEPNAIHQADLLFMPHDGDFKYILTVIDVATRKVDAEPLTSKKSDHIINAFKKIYKRSDLKQPILLRTDSGSEFKGSVKKFFEDRGTKLIYSLPGRHRQTGLVEALNKKIGTALFKRMTAQEILTGDKSIEWVDDLPVIVKAINDSIVIPNNKKSSSPVCDGESCELLEIGTKVRRALDMPINVHDEKRMYGKFRASDIRWHPEVRTVTNIILNADQPPMYQLDDGKGGTDRRVAYTRQQLQIITNDEQLPPPSVIRGKPKTFKVEKILDKKKMKGKIYYLVKWLGYPDSENTWEPATSLREDVPELVANFD
jgi:transposase InsO family protein